MSRTRDPFLPVKTENLEQRALFEEYVAMGSKRSLAKLLDVTDRAWKTVQAWSIKFNWVVRAATRDKEMMENVLIESPRESANRRKLSLDIVNKMIQDIAVLDKDGVVIDTTIKAKTVFDIRTLVDVRDEILGLKDKMEKTKASQTNIDKAIFIIRK
jgi:hypothetical protein